MERRDAVSFAAELRREGTLYVMHRNADPDCIASAFALVRAFGGAAAAPGGVSAAGRRVAAAVGFEPLPIAHAEKASRIVAVDTSSRAQLAGADAAGVPLLVVDHHAYGDLLGSEAHAFRDPERTSCAEVVLDLLTGAGVTIERPVALALLVGLVADTKRFTFANALSLRDAHALVSEHGIAMGEALAILEGADDDEEGDGVPRRNAMLLAASRAAVRERGGLLFAESRVSAFESSAAAGLVRIGADVAAVLSERGSASRLSLRGSPRLAARGVHLGEIANRLARESGWSGGGHELSAGLNGPPPGGPVQRKVVEAIEGAVG